MNRLKIFATQHPLSFVLLFILTWFLIGALVSTLATVLLGTSFFNPLAQSLGTLAATAFLLILSWQLGWLRAAGIADLGTWQGWLAGFGLVLYSTLAYQYAFFGEITIDLPALLLSSGASNVLWRQLLIGSVEEILFRGFVLYALVRVWGNTMRGLTVAVLVSAFLFGILHIFQAAEHSLQTGLQNAVEAFVSGAWYALFVLSWSTIWPVVFVHAASNAIVMLMTLSQPGLVLTINGYTLAVVLQLPLILLGFWWIRKQGPRMVAPDIP